MTKIVDNEPTLTYRGRRFEIQSDGFGGTGTRIEIDGIEQTNVIRIVIVIKANDFVRIYQNVVDLK